MCVVCHGPLPLRGGNKVTAMHCRDGHDGCHIEWYRQKRGECLRGNGHVKRGLTYQAANLRVTHAWRREQLAILRGVVGILQAAGLESVVLEGLKDA